MMTTPQEQPTHIDIRRTVFPVMAMQPDNSWRIAETMPLSRAVQAFACQRATTTCRGAYSEIFLIVHSPVGAYHSPTYVNSRA
jgi:hypothetical protein